MSDPDRNRANAIAFYELAFNECGPREAIEPGAEPLLPLLCFPNSVLKVRDLCLQDLHLSEFTERFSPF